ncbi:MAG: hypothetical protein H0T94_07100 [Acidimicrobiia bacterium]|nr:hypothetical protein [Acidimicrobiia bacterium]
MTFTNPSSDVSGVGAVALAAVITPIASTTGALTLAWAGLRGLAVGAGAGACMAVTLIWRHRHSPLDRPQPTDDRGTGVLTTDLIRDENLLDRIDSTLAEYHENLKSKPTLPED